MNTFVFPKQQKKYDDDDAEGFVEAYLAAIELQKSHNQVSRVSIELHLPPEVNHSFNIASLVNL